MTQLSLAEAIRLSKIKWQHYAEGKNSIELSKLHPELWKILFSCGFCERHKIKPKDGIIPPDVNCSACELAPKIGKCLSDPYSLYEQYVHTLIFDIDKKKALARLILAAICAVENEAETETKP